MLPQRYQNLPPDADRSGSCGFVILAEFFGILYYENKISATACAGKFPGEDTGH